MAVVTINKTQYKNLSCKLGKKNYINTVKGVEYKIDTSSTTEYSEGNKDCAPTELSNVYYTNYRWLHYDTIFISDTWLRSEVCYIKGSYTFTVTGKTITNLDNMTASYTLNYKSYSTSDLFISSGNYKSSSRVFSGIKADSNRPSSSYDEDTGTYSDYDGTTTDLLPLETAKSTGLATGNQTLTDATVPTQYCKVVYLYKVTSGDSVNPTYYFRVDFCFVVSTGWNTVSYDFWGNRSFENNYREVSNIVITVNGYSVEKEEIEVTVGGSDERGSKILELQTNELMQSSSSTNALSFEEVANEIIDAYQNNRLIATFDLVNNKKYTINGETRYLRAGDKIKITDLDGNYISSQGNVDGNEFEIIKANSKWNGFYYKEITAKEILPPVTYGIGYTVSGTGYASWVTFSCQDTASAGERVSFTISVTEAGYDLASVGVYDGDGNYCNYTKHGGVYTFAMPASDVTVIVKLCESSSPDTGDYSITLEQASHVTITSNVSRANEGDTITITAYDYTDDDDGTMYWASNITAWVDGKAYAKVEDEDVLTFTMPDSNVTVSVSEQSE